jgi:FkbM family methyltransferase
MKNLTSYFGYKLIKREEYDHLSQIANSNSFEFVQLMGYMGSNKEILKCFKYSKSQILQDVFVLIALNFKREGFFIEFGSSDGIGSSNTYILEKEYDWKGILVEPSKGFHKKLAKNRNSIIDHRCVYKESGLKVNFNETLNGYLSTIHEYSKSDSWKNHRLLGKKYEVETITLEDLLDTYSAPTNIDYLSIDTEGSEYDILKCFNFEKYKIRIITVEHNYVKESRNRIHALLKSKGYERVLVNISKFDDWYVNLKA